MGKCEKRIMQEKCAKDKGDIYITHRVREQNDLMGRERETEGRKEGRKIDKRKERKERKKKEKNRKKNCS